MHFPIWKKATWLYWTRANAKHKNKPNKYIIKHAKLWKHSARLASKLKMPPKQPRENIATKKRRQCEEDKKGAPTATTPTVPAGERAEADVAEQKKARAAQVAAKAS
eukprot:9487639-Pyramimonas_sp.AAC.1